MYHSSMNTFFQGKVILGLSTGLTTRAVSEPASSRGVDQCAESTALTHILAVVARGDDITYVQKSLKNLFIRGAAARQTIGWRDDWAGGCPLRPCISPGWMIVGCPLRWDGRRDSMPAKMGQAGVPARRLVTALYRHRAGLAHQPPMDDADWCCHPVGSSILPHPA
jgi:hypothetical protein